MDSSSLSSAPNTVDQVVHCYDEVAENYASKFLSELEHKPLDQLLLKDFASHFVAGSHKTTSVIDLGCGPGQTTKYLSEHGVERIVGTDISPAMIEQAKKHHCSTGSPAPTTPSEHSNSPHLAFEVANMLQLQYPDSHFNGALAFYSIVNFDYDKVKIAFQEIARILKPGGIFLFSFHVGDSIVQLNQFLEKEVMISFYFFDVDRIHQLLRDSGLQVVQTVIRYPYEHVEHPSKRAYITATKEL